MSKNDLSPEMQARLDKWKAQILPAKKVETFQRGFQHAFVPRRGDYGDDISDIENRQRDEWNRERENNKGTYGTAGK